MTSYYISRGVHFACDRDAVVFLNINSDEYSMFVGEKARSFSTMVSVISGSHDALRVTTGDTSPEGNELQREIVADLLANKLITDKVCDAATYKPNIPLPHATLVDYQDTHPDEISWRDVRRFFAACIVATWRPQCTSMHAIICALQRRKHRAHAGRSRPLDDFRQVVATYRTLRPFFPRDFVCLFDSLSLMEFLARYDLFPDLVFAVKLDPWGAHCWVQHGSVSLNEDHDEACSYLPIVAV